MRIWTLAAVTVLLVAASTGHAQPDRHVQRAPFTDIRFEDDAAPLIEVDGQWYRWLALDDIPIERIEEGASRIVSNRTDPDYWQKKRMAEDLVTVLAAIEHTAGPTVRLKVAPVDGVEGVRTLIDVPMTHENRDRVRDVRGARERGVDPAPDLRAEREAVFVGFGAPAALQEVAAVVIEHHAYALLKGLDVQALVEQELARLGDAPRRRETILAAHRIVCRLGDGHASIGGWLSDAPGGRLNVLFQRARSGDAPAGLVAFRREPDARRGELLAEGYPFVESIDGVPIERWLEAAAAYVTDGSEALVSSRSADMLRYINLVRDELGLPRSEQAEFVLRSAAGETTRVVEPVTGRRAIYGDWPRPTPDAREHGFSIARLPQNVAHVRLHEMGGEEAAAALRHELEQMLDADGVILDVRGNGGGSRAHLCTLLPLFMAEEARVVNIAARRLPRTTPRPPEGWLANRYAFPVNWDGWTDAQRAAVEAVMADFTPEWRLPEGEFSDWHAMVVLREPDDPRYEGPVVVLMDEGCFSATDIFLGGFKGVDGVTLIGAPSSGGSARSNSHDLVALETEVKLATMASFQPDGRLYDGNGIQPDILLVPTVEDLLGHTDTMLDAAIGLIAGAEPGR